MSEQSNYRLGPAYLEEVTIADKPETWVEEEWTGKLQTKEGRTQFRLYYYGELMDGLIATTDFAPQLILAEDPITEERFILFDGCKHGYNAMLCDTYSKEQHTGRLPLQPYVDQDGEDTFEMYITAYYNVDWGEEFSDDVDEQGRLMLISGGYCDFEEAKRNGYDALSLTLVNRKGRKTEAVQEELA